MYVELLSMIEKSLIGLDLPPLSEALFSKGVIDRQVAASPTQSANVLL